MSERPPCDDDDDNDDKEEKKDAMEVTVVIIGAGASGLQCAFSLGELLVSQEQLEQQEQSILVLEARHRVGGRIHSTVLPQQQQQQSKDNNGDNRDNETIMYDHGAAWVHGTEGDNNPMMELLSKASSSPPVRTICAAGNPWMCPKHLVHQKLLQLFVNGTALNNNNINNNDDDGTTNILQASLARHAASLDAVDRYCHDCYQRGRGNELRQQSLHHVLTETMVPHLPPTENGMDDRNDQKKDKDQTAIQNWIQLVTPFYMHLLECWYGCSVHTLPVSDCCGLGSSDHHDDTHHHCGVGDYPGPHSFVPNGMMTVLQPLLQKRGHTYQVSLGQRVTKIRADHNKSKIIVETNHGERRIAARVCVCTLPIACLQEAVSQQNLFEPTLSPQKIAALQCLQMGCYKKVLLTFTSIFWPVHAPFLGLVQDNDNNNPLGHYLLLDNLWAKTHGRPILEAVLFGTAGEWSIGQEDDAIKVAVLEFIQTSMGEIATCTACHITRWEEDPYSRGAYSSLSVAPPLGGTTNSSINNDPVAELNVPEYNHRLHFAGEATVPEYQGSVHAALISGQETAQTVYHQHLATTK